MHRSPNKGRILPKISTMPRQKAEAATFLDIYKLVIEKKRLQQELQSIEQRRQQILDRLTLLGHQVAQLEQTAQQLRAIEDGSVQRLTDRSTPTPLSPDSSSPAAHAVELDHPLFKEFETLFLDY